MIVHTYLPPEFRMAKIFKDSEYNAMVSFIALQRDRGKLENVRVANCGTSARVIVHYFK